jgi:uncharacterized damage-inducible protein DinB
VLIAGTEKRTIDGHDRPVTDDYRTAPPLIADERTMLCGWLDWHRETLAAKCAGLTPAQLAEWSVPPSSMSLLGLVRHLTEVERTWFQRVLAGEDAPPLYYSDEYPDGEFDLVDPATTDAAVVDAAFAAWNADCARSREVVAAMTLDDVRPRRDEEISVRWVLVHMIEEYARHNGHADLLRERIDGVTGE